MRYEMWDAGLRDFRFKIAVWRLKSSMLDTGYSMLDKDLPFTDPPSVENLTPNY
jgi:hypothetical protein